ncbi:MarR family winged helix-turn-helix transcriptional regulator [Microbacterium sp.]|uniref:MarR family winged helix-turn-helix transcriptional regulator n=1 Tax=Microbacterium sp. TaxID=51671 RepID=UPI0033410F14
MGQQKPRSSPTQDQLRVWRDYIETAEALRDRLATRMQDESSLSTGDYRVLLALNEAEGRRMRSSELAEAIGWERSRLSHHLGRMERRGLIARAACAEVAHGVDVLITDAGRERFRTGSVPHLHAVKELFVDALTPVQLDHVDGLSRALRAHLGLDGETVPGSSRGRSLR